MCSPARSPARSAGARARPTAVKEFAKANKVVLKKSYAYSNGAEDVPFLAAVGHPCALNADAGTRRDRQAERGGPSPG